MAKIARSLQDLSSIVDRVKAMRQGTDRSREGLERTSEAYATLDGSLRELTRLGAEFKT